MYAQVNLPTITHTHTRAQTSSIKKTRIQQCVIAEKKKMDTKAGYTINTIARQIARNICKQGRGPGNHLTGPKMWEMPLMLQLQIQQ